MDLNILYLEPFFGGSHKDFALGLRQFSRHRITLQTLSPRFWKWRMRGAALSFIDRVQDLASFDLVIASSLMSLSDVKALTGPACPKTLFYLHENQLSYPLSPGETMDYQYGYTNITSCLAADAVLFNSRFHMEDFFSRLPGFIDMMPDHRPRWITETIKEKSSVQYPGCHFPSARIDRSPRSGTPPTVVWNHRWEHDKDPEMFFRTLHRLKEERVSFSLIVLGEQFDRVPPIFDAAQKEFTDSIHHWGYVTDKEEYYRLLSRGDIIVSTALQENFGISVVEAMRYGCYPLLPSRLSYPEILPYEFHHQCLYTSEEDLRNRLKNLLVRPESVTSLTLMLSRNMEKHAWEKRINAFDDCFEEIVRHG